MSKRAILLGLLAVTAAWAVWSYASGGLTYLLVAAATDNRYGIDTLRSWVLSWGALAPLVYVLAVTIEVMVAPIPGTLLYAPAGAIFGGAWGGTLSLAGNVLGASIATWIGGVLGEGWVSRRLARDDLERYRQRLLARATWIVFLLRVNPFTSSDIVSYVAGAIGVPVRKVAIGTLVGMAPLCYAQAYLSATLFEFLPGGIWIIVGLGAVYVAIVIALLLKR
jgi:uncharacterized membrane protein YdjX (TVP38/TMEM64 family)